MTGKRYIRPWRPQSWWLRRPTWFLYMVREASAVVVVLYTVFLLVLLGRAAGDSSLASLYHALRSPLSLVLHLIALAFLLFHAGTWFTIAAQALPLWRGQKRVSTRVVVAVFLGAWVVASAVLVWLFLRA